MTIKNLKTKKVFAWKPPNTTAKYKITVTRSDGTVDDISNLATECVVEDNVTESIGSFSFKIWDPTELYANIWVGNEVFLYYKDYAATATTLRFRGRIEKPSKVGNRLNCKGRSESFRLINLKVNKSYSAATGDTIIKDLFTTYAPEITTTNVVATTEILTIDFYEKDFWECIQEVCRGTACDAYVDSALDCHYFTVGAIVNNGEAIIHDYNMMEISDFTPDLTLIRNKIRVYGATQEGIQPMATAEQKTGVYGTSGSFPTKIELINDDSIVTTQQAQIVADYELSQRKNPPTIGEVKGLLLATIQPGEQINLSSPSDKISPGLYTTTGYKDELNIDKGFYTTVYVNKEPRKVSHVIKERVQSENKLKSTSTNPEGLDSTVTFLFNVDVGSHTTTEIVDGVLKPTGATGTWLSSNTTLTSSLNKIYLVMNGETLTDVTVSVSGDNGNNYEAISNRSSITMSTAKGNNIKIKVEFASANPQITSLQVLYSED